MCNVFNYKPYPTIFFLLLFLAMAPIIDNYIKILQWNVQGITTSKEDILSIVEEYQPLIMAFQETFLANEFSINIKGYNNICKQGNFNRRFHGGVAIYVHDSIPQEIIEINSHYQALALKVNIHRNRPISVLNMYIPGRESLVKAEISGILDQIPKPCIVMGDFNAHHTVWGNQHTYQRGRLLEETFTEKQLNILNDGSPTHESGTAIDLTAVSPTIAGDMIWEVLESPRSSDHHPILIYVNTRSTNNAENCEERFNHKKGNYKGIGSDPLWNELPEEVGDDPHQGLGKKRLLLNLGTYTFFRISIMRYNSSTPW